MSRPVRLRVNPWVACFFVALLATGLALFRDYGISWDELPTREYGVTYAIHAVPDLPALEEIRARSGYGWERHGPAFELGLVAMERAARFDDLRTVFFARHLATFLVFYAAVALFYAFARRRFGAWLSLAGTACLVCTPTLFAHAFYNAKDIPFLALFSATMLGLAAWLERPTWRMAAVQAILTALLVSTRVLGLLALAMTVALMLLRRRDRATCLKLAAYVALVAIALPVFWPVLRIDYWHVLSRTVANASNNALSPRVVRFWGDELAPGELPWYYAPSWMLVTIPIPYLVAFVAGAIAFARDASSRWRHWLAAPGVDVVALGWGIAPLASTMLLRPALYDGWRHLFFVYPAVLYVAMRGVEAAWTWSTRWTAHWPKLARPIVAATALLVAITPGGVFMAASHPFEHLYFNRFAGPDLATARARFDFDYWGLSYRPMLEELVRADPAPVLRVAVENFPGAANAIMLDPGDRRRLRYVASLDSADYFVTNFRFSDDPDPRTGLLYSLRLGNATIGSIFRLRAP